MKIIDAVPLTKLPYNKPQILTYLSPTDKVQMGCLVMAPLYRRKTKAVVVDIRNFSKLEIKNYNYKLKPILGIVNKKSHLSPAQAQLASWISNYYLEPLSLVCKTIVKQSKLSKIKKLTIKPTGEIRFKLFAQYANLKSIIIEQEHNNLYKSQQAPRFNARDIALKLAQIKRIPIKLTSDSPSIEAYYHYNLAAKINKKTKMHLIDMKQEKNDIFSQKLLQKIQKAKSVLLCINRCGAASALICRKCGWVLKCKNCDVPLVYHPNDKNLLQCHHCSFKTNIPPLKCPQCQNSNLDYLGGGVDKIKQEIKKYNLPGKVYISTIKEKLPQTDLTALICADTALYLPDFRSAENTFYNLVKLNNLAKKDFIIQTYHPNHYVFNLDSFYQNELKIRKKFNYPPFCQLIKLTFRHKSPQYAQEQAYKLSKKLKNNFNLDVLGPAPGFISKKRNYYFWNILVKLPNQARKLKQNLRKLVPDNWIVNVDPLNTL